MSTKNKDKRTKTSKQNKEEEEEDYSHFFPKGDKTKMIEFKKGMMNGPLLEESSFATLFP